MPFQGLGGMRSVGRRYGGGYHFLVGAFELIVCRCAGHVECLVVVFAHPARRVEGSAALLNRTEYPRRCSTDVSNYHVIGGVKIVARFILRLIMAQSTSESTGPFGISWSTFFPFSSSALASLPENTPRPARYTRQDDIPNYDAIQSHVRVPRKVSSAIKVEGKVWFANERSVSPSPSPSPRSSPF
jgi:hypothetical protein